MSTGPATVAYRTRQTGMTLVEVLVTLVSTSVGLLGIAALQLVSLKSNQEAYVRLQASSLASSMLDRIRTNPQGFAAGEYDSISFNATGAAHTRAGADLNAWQAEIDRQLPGGVRLAAGAIQRTPDGNVVTVTIRWGDRRDASAAEEKTLQLRTEI